MNQPAPASTPTTGDSIIGLYQRHGAAWAAARGDRLVEGAWLDRFRAMMPPQPRVLDLGCGAGKPIARHLASLGCHITGVDSAPCMIALCRDHLPGHSWHVADMRTLACRETFAGIVAWDSFFHLGHDDQRRMFAIFRAHAAPDAALMFTTGWHHGEAVGMLGGEPIYHASLDPDEYRALLAAAGFAVRAHVDRDPTCGHRTIWLAQRF